MFVAEFGVGHVILASLTVAAGIVIANSIAYCITAAARNFPPYTPPPYAPATTR